MGVITLDANGTSFALSVEDGQEEQAMKQLRTFYTQSKEEGAAPMKTRLDAAEAYGQAVRDILVGEIIRLRKLSAPTSEGGEEQFNAEAERQYLEGLPADRLAMEWRRTPAPETVKTDAKTKNENPPNPADPYEGRTKA